MNPPLLEWTADLQLGESVMDETHREFVDLLNRLGATGGDALLDDLDAFIAHTVEHFAQEERWMEEIAFPPLHCHHNEHAGVLEVMREVRKRVAGGEAHLGNTLAVAIAEWFPLHAGSMDAVLALYMKQIGYVPGADNAAAIAAAAALAQAHACAKPCGPAEQKG